jgi:hypothetical protein
MRGGGKAKCDDGGKEGRREGEGGREGGEGGVAARLLLGVGGGSDVKKPVFSSECRSSAVVILASCEVF